MVNTTKVKNILKEVGIPVGYVDASGNILSPDKQYEGQVGVRKGIYDERYIIFNPRRYEKSEEMWEDINKAKYALKRANIKYRHPNSWNVQNDETIPELIVWEDGDRRWDRI